MQAHTSPQKVCDENKLRIHKNVFDGRNEFIKHAWKSYRINFSECQINGSQYNNCLVSE